MGSSDRKSSTRRFHKVLSTLKGNSPNSSLNVPNKDMSDISNPYYEQNSPLLKDDAVSSEFMKVSIGGKVRSKKNSSKNIRTKLADN